MSGEQVVHSGKKKSIIYIFLTLITLVVFWQVTGHDFIGIDDPVYVTQNIHIQSGFHAEALRWAFSTTHAEFWHPLTWLSLMLDYRFYGLNPAGFHLTNLILHLLSTLLLFQLFNRMTGSVWPSAFVAALFALHPLRVQSVAWIAERKDVLCALFWMLTLYLYVYYTEKPAVKKYLSVLFLFALALMSKPVAVTLPVVMILLDYWPLNRFESEKNNMLMWQLKEKAPFFILSAAFSAITFYAQYRPQLMRDIPFESRLANSCVSFAAYLGKILWPHDIHLFHSFAPGLPCWQVLAAAFLITAVSATAIVAARSKPYLLVGWLWYAVTVLPVLGIFKVGPSWMHDHYVYIPSTGIGIMLAWGIPSLIKNEKMRKRILFPAGILLITLLSLLTWKQCGYWKNTVVLLNHTLEIKKDSYTVHFNRGSAFGETGDYQKAIEDYNEAIRLKPDYAEAYFSRGCAYAALGQYRQTIGDCSEAIRLNPAYVDAYINRGSAYAMLGRYKDAIEDFSRVISLQPDYINAYNNRAIAYIRTGNEKSACEDARKACGLGNCKLLELARGRGHCH